MIYTGVNSGLIALFIVQRTVSDDSFLSRLLYKKEKRTLVRCFFSTFSFLFFLSFFRANYKRGNTCRTIGHAKDPRLMETHFSSIVLLSSPALLSSFPPFPFSRVDRAPSRSSTRATFILRTTSNQRHILRLGRGERCKISDDCRKIFSDNQSISRR